MLMYRIVAYRSLSFFLTYLDWKTEAPANYLLNICDSTVDEKCSKTIENMSFLILKNHRLFVFAVQKWLNFQMKLWIVDHSVQSY